MTSHRCVLSRLCSRALCGSASPAPPRRRSARIPPRGGAARHRGRRSPSAARGSPTPRKSSSTRPASPSRSSRSSTTARSRRRSRSPPTAGSASTPSASAPRPASRELRTFWVGALPVVEEKEPNSDFATPQKIPLNVTVHGVVDNEDVDYFVVEAKKGQRLSRRGRGHAARRTRSSTRTSPSSTASGSSWPRPTTRRCSAGRRAARSSPRPTASTSSRSARAPTAATARASTGCTSARSRGRRPCVPAGGKPGEEVEVTLPRRPAGRDQAEGQAARRHAPDDKFGVFCQDAGRASPVRASRSALTDVGQRDRGRAERHAATRPRQAPLPLAFNGVIDKAGRRRPLQVRGQEGAGVRRPLLRPPARLAARLGDVHRLHRPAAALVGNDDAVGPDSYFRFTIPAGRRVRASASPTT